MTSTTDTSPPTPPAIAIKSASFDAVRIALGSADLETLKGELQGKLDEAGAYFEDEPVVVDASLLDDPLDWPATFALLRERGMKPVGAVASGINADAALEAGIAVLELRSIAPRAVRAPVPPAAEFPSLDVSSEVAPPPTPVPAPPPELAAAPAPPVRTMVIHRPLRSGQRVYARGSDLIVMGFVSRGAEVIADGHIHVYGPLRGRAIAGAMGDAGARIFSTHLDAELVSIAGIYRTTENPLPPQVQGQAGVVRLVGEKILIEALAQD